ncbi:MAG: PKD domain-containing protein [Bacteroidia bacterium]
MNNSFIQLFSRIGFVLLLASVVLMSSCKPDDTPVEGPVASFQYEASMDDFLEISFSNFSKNASSYSWDFGDSNTSTESAPTHTYAAAGTYTVTLKASNDAGESASFNETIEVTDPNAQLAILAGDAGTTTGKTWYLQREGIPMGIGPADAPDSWWAFGNQTPLAERPCVLDDAYTFYRDGKFEANTNGTLFVDATANGGWLINANDVESCHDESEAGVWGDNSDRSDFGNGGDYTYVMDNGAATLTLNGSGAYIALATKTESGDNTTPVSAKTYSITKIAEGPVADTMHLTLSDGTTFIWSFYLVSYHNAADLPPIPTDIPVFGEDYPNVTPAELSHTFSAAGASVMIDSIVSGSTIEYGVDDPTDPAATKVGQFNRTNAQYQELKFQTSPTKNDIEFTNMTTITLEVYLPSSNDYSNKLTRQVLVGIADQSQTAQWWTDFYQYESATELNLDEWIPLTFDISMPNSGGGAGTPMDRNDLDMLFINIGGADHTETGTFYVRNFSIK